MKTRLLSMIFLFTIFSANLSASEINMSKQEMMRGTPTSSIQSEAILSEGDNIDMSSNDIPSEERSNLATMFATVIIVTIVGLLSTFITKFALSLRSNSSSEND